MEGKKLKLYNMLLAFSRKKDKVDEEVCWLSKYLCSLGLWLGRTKIVDMALGSWSDDKRMKGKKGKKVREILEVCERSNFML